MDKNNQRRIRELSRTDKEGPEIAWDKGQPKYRLKVGAKTFLVRNLSVWCNFYEVNYQMLSRIIRDERTEYQGIVVEKL